MVKVCRRYLSFVTLFWDAFWKVIRLLNICDTILRGLWILEKIMGLMVYIDINFNLEWVLEIHVL